MASDDYTSFWAENARTFDKQSNPDIDALIKRICRDVGRVQRVLDVAAGTGNVSLAMARQAGQVDALDLEPEMIAVLREKAAASGVDNISFHVQSAYELDFPDRVFDAVVILNSLHVMKTPEAALCEARRVLRSSGVLLAPTYCHAETRDNLERYLHCASRSGHKSHHLFTCDSLCTLIDGCGFEVMKRETVEINYEEQSPGLMLGYVVACPASAVS
ncbi:class I SAM-dependent methyltransferase [Prosthecochloris sp. N3]|uniref:Class I SAM-dependent methyltransferase n=2 Tax=Prosthecochloris ethylica TaxID=2743976 RepID=A0ABR9XPX8_9CHLB|nr:class I SAM-dependent methyltransferase [Prosthecochloris ethylica]MBF0587256.1 class I SAM-dependent methyltransferase [Prosthecochloris ethylica]MBF0636050.1 class I SAM-dependent methyltransferase [Prosthecochloris ethylica]